MRVGHNIIFIHQSILFSPYSTPLWVRQLARYFPPAAHHDTLRRRKLPVLNRQGSRIFLRLCYFTGFGGIGCGVRGKPGPFKNKGVLILSAGWMPANSYFIIITFSNFTYGYWALHLPQRPVLLPLWLIERALASLRFIRPAIPRWTPLHLGLCRWSNFIPT